VTATEALGSAVEEETPNATGVDLLPSLAQRLRAAADVLLDDVPPRVADVQDDAARLTGALLDHARASGDRSAAWLTLIAVAAAFPTRDEVSDFVRAARTSPSGDVLGWLLDTSFQRAWGSGSPDLEMDVVVGQVVVDVDFCATSDLHTGIQRVVRETLPRWQRNHDLIMVGWTGASGAFRGLDGTEKHRVLRWGTAHEPSQTPPSDPHRLVVPWRSAVVLPENPEPQRCAALAALAESSGNHLRVIGYDCIPIVSPELIHPGLPDRFVRYLSVLKYATTIAGISVSATAEFAGFAAMLQSQGLPGPTVVECSLPVEVPHTAEPRPVTARPVVMSVGSFEPRKNQLAVLHAAERLWREGLDFELDFVGGGGYRTEFDALRQRLLDRGRTIRVRVAITDEELWRTYRSARFSVFASLHEGFGLPVAESVAYGTPALTTNYGSTAEIARDGGVVTVDPRDDDALLAAMRRLLTDDGLIDRLRDEAARRPPRTWDDYAAELWPLLTTGAAEEQR
jgi:glycosyltransferase involved in cell wall biosynthesis